MCFHKILPNDITRHHFGTTSLFKISMLCAQDLEFVISDKHTLLHDFGIVTLVETSRATNPSNAKVLNAAYFLFVFPDYFLVFSWF